MTQKKRTRKPKQDAIGPLVKEALQVLEALDGAKELYKRMDEITLLLKGKNLAGTGLEMVDNFSEKNVVFRPAGVRRFELKRVKS